MAEEFETVIGLEVHAQLSTDSKIFGTDSAVSGKFPNTQTDQVTLGLPGALPVLNKRVVDFAIKLGLATNCSIERESIFARKHYFYPDLPKGYQISQYDKPICLKGNIIINVDGQKRKIGITRIHLEEDAGKNTHHGDAGYSEVDLNRAGVPLVEIVSEPDMRSADEAGAYMRKLRQLLRYTEVCDGNMEEGSMRCDANVSVRKIGESKFGTKVEIKNLNSFRHVEKAITYEVNRQIATIQSGEKVLQETRLWDDAKEVTKTMRSKEHAEDYRYFPDPDLLPLIVDNEWIEKIRANLPELPDEVKLRFKKMYGLDDYFSEILTEEKHVSQYYDNACEIHNNPPAIANWITTELFGRLNKEGMNMDDCAISPENLSMLVKYIDEGLISGKIAKTVFDEMFSTGSTPKSIIEAKGLVQVSDPKAIEEVVTRVLAANPTQLADYRQGKTKMLGFFVGQIMKETGGKANPKLVNEILERKLK